MQAIGLKCVMYKNVPVLSIGIRRLLTETKIDPVYDNANIELVYDTVVRFVNQFDAVSIFCLYKTIIFFLPFLKVKKKIKRAINGVRVQLLVLP
jgi:hypothetical protein